MNFGPAMAAHGGPSPPSAASRGSSLTPLSANSNGDAYQALFQQSSSQSRGSSALNQPGQQQQQHTPPQRNLSSNMDRAMTANQTMNASARLGQTGLVRVSLHMHGPPSCLHVPPSSLTSARITYIYACTSPPQGISDADNIKVAMRVRPLQAKERESGAVSVLHVTEDHGTVKVSCPSSTLLQHHAAPLLTALLALFVYRSLCQDQRATR